MSGFIMIGKIGNFPADIDRQQIAVAFQQGFYVSIQLADSYHLGRLCQLCHLKLPSRAIPAALSAENVGEAKLPPNLDSKTCRNILLDITPPA